MLSKCRESFCHIWRLSLPWVLQPPQTRNMVLKQFCVSEKLSVLEFQSISLPKMCPGSRRKWVRAFAMPCFSEHGHYRRSAETSEKLKQTKRSVLAVLCKIIVSPLDPFYFYCFPFLLLVFPRFVHAYLCLALLSFILFSVSFSMPMFPSPLLFSAILPYSPLISSPRSCFYFGSSDELVKWYSVQKMENTF